MKRIEDEDSDCGDVHSANIHVRNSILGVACMLARLISLPLWLIIKLGLYFDKLGGLVGLCGALLVIVLFPLGLVLTLIFVPMPSLLKAVVSIYLFVAWGLLRQFKDDADYQSA